MLFVAYRQSKLNKEYFKIKSLSSKVRIFHLLLHFTIPVRKLRWYCWVYIWRCMLYILAERCNYNIVRTLFLSKPYWAIMNKTFMYARPCSVKWRVQFHFSGKLSFEFSASSFCLSFGNVKVIPNNPNPTSSLWLLPGKDVYFNVSILTLFVSIFTEYLYFVWLRFHYNLA